MNIDKYQNLVTTQHDSLGRWYGTPDNTYQYPGVTTVLHEVLRNKWEGKDPTNMEKAAKKGTMLHEILRKRFTDKEQIEEEEYQKVISHFDQWVAVKKVKPIYHEIKIASEKYGYAGTIDLVAEVGGKVTVVDYKTGFEYDNKWGLQIAAYHGALAEVLGLNLKDLGLGILHIPLRNSNAFKWLLFQHFDWLQRGFLACLELYKHQPRFTELKRLGWPYLMAPCVEVNI